MHEVLDESDYMIIQQRTDTTLA